MLEVETPTTEQVPDGLTTEVLLDEEGDEMPEQREEDYPNRVPPEERLSVILLGPPKTGKSTIAHALEVEHSRKRLTVDECIDWVLSNPKSIRDDYVAEKLVRKIRDAQGDTRAESAEEVPTLERDDVVAAMRYRLDLPDCNAGVVWDGCSQGSKYVGDDTVECILAAIPGEESVKFITFRIDSASDEGSTPEDALAAYYSRLEEVVGEELLKINESLAESEQLEEREDAPNDVENLARAELVRRKEELDALVQWFKEEGPVAKAGQYMDELSARINRLHPTSLEQEVTSDGREAAEVDAEEETRVNGDDDAVEEVAVQKPETSRITTWHEILITAEEPDLTKTVEQILATVEPPSFPRYGRLPPSKTVQLIRRPTQREARAPSGLFTLLTPIVNDEGIEELREQSRWVIQSKAEQRIIVQFYVTKTGTFTEQLGFEIVAGGFSPVQTFVDVTGIAGFPKINNDSRNVFMRRVKNRPRGGYSRKQFITSQNVFDFGPLLAGRTIEMRDALLELDQDDPERLAGERLWRRHAETLRVTNNSLFRAEVRCSMASAMAAGPGQVTEDPDTSEDFPQFSLEECPFVIEPSQFTLEQDETKDLLLWCFPQREGQVRDTITILVKDNPEVFKWDVEALGGVPAFDLDTDLVDFGSLMVNQRDSRTIRMENVAAIPIEWELLATGGDRAEDSETVPPGEISIEPMSGHLAIGEVTEITIIFHAEDTVSHDFVMNMVVRDCEGLNRFAPEPRPIHFKAQGFKVQVSVVIPREADGLSSNIIDFGDVRIGQVAERSFELVNDGEHAVDYSLVVRGKMMRRLLSVDPARSTLEPGHRQTVSTALVCPRAMSVIQSPELFMKLVETRTKEEVKPEMPPFKITAKAHFNRVTVSPSTDVDFGTFIAGEAARQILKVTNDGVFETPWSLLDMSKLPDASADGIVPTLEPTWTVGPFSVTPTSGVLLPGGTVELTVTFAASEEDNFSAKFGLLVEGTESGEPILVKVTGESYIPGLDTENMHLLFEEQFTSKTREDAEAIAGSADLRVYCEDERLFSYGPVMVGRSVTERFRLSNPTGITVDVECKIESTYAGTPYTLSPSNLSIPPFEYRYVTMAFNPQAVGAFAAKFSAVVPAGTDPSTNSLTFDVQGDGVLPALTLKAPAFTTTTDAKNLGFEFGELPVGATRNVSFLLTNEHRIDATYRLERSGSGMRSFSITGPATETLKPGETRQVRVGYAPQVASDNDELLLKIVTAHNEDESRTMKVTGRGVMLPVEWLLPQENDEENESVPSVGSYYLHDLLDLGDVPVGSDNEVALGLKNISDHAQRFELAEIADPQLRNCVDIVPSIGHVYAGETKTVIVRVKPAEKIVLEKARLLFKLIAIDVDSRRVSWDNSQYARLTGNDESTARPEPIYNTLSDSPTELPLRVSVRADSISYSCSQEEPIVFVTTILYHARQYTFVLENTSDISFDYSWRVANTAHGSTAHRAFTVKPSSGRLSARAKLDVVVRFSPTEMCDFSTVRLELMLPQVDEGTPALALELDASATCPVCHFELIECPTLPGRDDVRVIQFESLGTGVRNRKRFCVLNTTKEKYRFFWVDHRQALPDGCAADDGLDEPNAGATMPGSSLQPFGCVTRDGEIASGKKYEMELLYTPMTTGRHESFWTFRVPSQNLVVPLQLVGTVREPRVDVDLPSVNFGKVRHRAVAPGCGVCHRHLQVLINYETRRTVNLVNREHLPFQFVIDSGSWLDPPLTVSPMKGTSSTTGSSAVISIRRVASV